MRFPAAALFAAAMSTGCPVVAFAAGEDDAWGLLRAGRTEEAARAFRALVSDEPTSSDAVRGFVTALIRDARTAEAIDAAQSHLDLAPSGADAWAHLGRAYLAAGRFDEAEQALLESVSLSDSPLGQWGLGRIAESRGDSASARERFDEARRLAPHDPEILESWLRVLDDPEREHKGWSLWLGIDRGSKPTTRSFVESVLPSFPRYAAHRGARLQLREGAKAPVVLPLERLPRLLGSRLEERRLTVAVKPAKGRDRRLLLDTGAHGLTLSPSAARAMGFQEICSIRLQGAGDRAGGAKAKLGVVRGFDLGPLTYRDGLAVRSSDANFPSGIDGILGIDLFAPWILELDVDRLELRVLSRRAEPVGFRNAATRRVDNHILVEAVVAGRVRGWFLLDSGASHTALDLAAAEGLGGRTRDAEWWVQGITGVLKDLRTVPEATLEVAGMSRRDPGLLAYSLDGISGNLGVRVAGVLGLSFFEGIVVRIDTVRAAVFLRKSVEDDEPVR